MLSVAELSASSAARVALELTHRRRLFPSHSTGDNLRASIAFRPHCRSVNATEHRELTDVRQGVSKRSLNQLRD